jgi:threonine dehydratase
LAVQIPERPGALLQFCNLIGRRTITEFNYRYKSNTKANIFVGIERGEDFDHLLRKLSDENYVNLDLSNDECAKIHVRHMIGGVPDPMLKNEQIYRFQFPERPGALFEFLSGLKSIWNITLFHYRNHGSAYGRVLVGLDIPPSDTREFNDFISKLNFKSCNETLNKSVSTFLSSGSIF